MFDMLLNFKTTWNFNLLRKFLTLTRLLLNNNELKSKWSWTGGTVGRTRNTEIKLKSACRPAQQVAKNKQAAPHSMSFNVTTRAARTRNNSHPPATRTECSDELLKTPPPTFLFKPVRILQKQTNHSQNRALWIIAYDWSVSGGLISGEKGASRCGVRVAAGRNDKEYAKLCGTRRVWSDPRRCGCHLLRGATCVFF